MGENEQQQQTAAPAAEEKEQEQEQGAAAAAAGGEQQQQQQQQQQDDTDGKAPCRFQSQCKKKDSGECPFFHYDPPRPPLQRDLDDDMMDGGDGGDGGPGGPGGDPNSHKYCWYGPRCMRTNCTYRHSARPGGPGGPMFAGGPGGPPFGGGRGGGFAPRGGRGGPGGPPPGNFGPGGPGGPPPGVGKAGIPCKFQLNCTRTDCPYRHFPAGAPGPGGPPPGAGWGGPGGPGGPPPGGFPGAPGRGRPFFRSWGGDPGRGGFRPTGPRAPPDQTICRYFLKGECRNSDTCKFLHTKPGPDAVAPTSSAGSNSAAPATNGSVEQDAE